MNFINAISLVFVVGIIGGTDAWWGGYGGKKKLLKLLKI